MHAGEKQEDMVESDPRVVPPTVSCVPPSPRGRERRLLTKDMVTFRQHLFIRSSFFSKCLKL